MARLSHHAGKRRRDHLTVHPLFPLLPRLVVFLVFILFLYYFLHRERQLFSEVRLPSGVLRLP